jgi:hypothetical protein
MRKLIGKMRRQPKHRRDTIALGIASGFTLLVATIWLYNVPSTLNRALSTADSPESREEGFFDTLGSQAAAVKESVPAAASIKESLKALVDEYRASSTQASSSQSAQVNASSSATTSQPVTSNESFERFTTDSSYESEKKPEVRIQTISKATTSTTTAE